MRNFKKLFATVAAALVVSTTIPASTLGASYSTELQGAYDYAYGVGITTQSSADSANLYGDLTRAAMAKMMSNYAVEVLGKKADTTKTCTFGDVTSSLGDLEASITKACQLGIMGVGMTSFNPQGKVTRAEFGTALSRALFGETNNGGTPYYTNHLSALKEAGVMTNISNPNAKEVRGYVMLMMKRADESGVATSTKPAICQTPENTLACSMGLSTCPTECKTVVKEPTEVKAGSLTVSLNSATSANGTQVPSTGTVRFAVVDFKASSSDVSLKTIELSKIGLASIPSSTRVWFEKDGVRVSGKAAFTSEGTAVISFAPVYVVKAGNTSTLDLYVELGTSEGKDFQFASNTIDTSAQDVNGSFTTPTLRTANYTVAPITIAVASAAASYNASADAVELGAFSITNNDTSSETRDVNFKSITVRQNGTAELTNISDIVLVRNGVVVAKNPTVNGKDLTFSVSDTIKDGGSATYYLKAVVSTVDANAGDTYIFAVRYATDVNAVESVSAFRSTVTGTPTLNTYTVKGGDVTFSKDTSVELSTNYAAGSDNVILMQGTISAKNPITLEDITLTGNNTGLSNLFSTIYLKVGSSMFSYSPAAGESVAKFLGTATINGSASVKMYGKLKDTATATSVKFDDLKLASFTRAEYVSNSNTVASSVGSIAGVTVTVQTATLNVTKSDALGNQTIAKGANGLLVYGLKLTSDQGNGSTISNAVFTVASSNTGDLYNNAYLTLYVNGVAKGSKTVQGGTVSFDSFNVNVTKTSSVTLEVKADMTDVFASGNVQVSLSSLNAVDSLTSKAVTYAKPAGAVFTVATAAGTIASSDNNPKAQLFLSPSAAKKLIAFKLTAKNDDVRIYDVTLTGTSLSALSNFALVDATGTVIATANTANDTGVTFTQIANAPKVLKDKSETYYVVADVNSNTTTAAIALTLASANIKSTNGSVIAAAGTVASNTHGTAENTLVVAKAANTSKLLTTSALRFTVTANGKDSISLSGINLNNQIAGYTGAGLKVVVYKNSVSASNIAGSKVGTTGIVSLTGNNTVDAGNTVTYIVVIENAVIDSASNSQDWSMSLTDVMFGSLSANAFDNIASFPITETK